MSRTERLPALLALLTLVACDGGGVDGDAAVDGTPSTADSEGGALTLTWLDDETVASGVAFHQLGGRFTAPASLESQLPALARTALTERATELGFTRLDDLQFAMRCDEAASPDVACSGEIAAVASR